MAREKEDKPKVPKVPPTLSEALAELQKMGIEVAGMGTDQKIENIERFPTGLLCLDYLLGGGYPRGRIIELYGWESSGKSTMTMISMAECQRNGGAVALIDAEHAHDPKYASNLGVDPDKLLVVQPNTGEEGLAVVEKLAETGKFQLIVVDSVAALTPADEMAGEMGDKHMGKQAKMMSEALRRLTPIVSRSKTTVIFINQIRQKIGVVYGNPETTPGGMALKFYASIRFKVSKKEKLKRADDTIYGHLIKVFVEKSKVSQQYLSTDFELRFGGLGLNLEADTVDAAMAAGIIKKDGTKYIYRDETISIGYAKLISALTENPDTYAMIRKDVTDKIAELKGTPVSSIRSGVENIVPETPKKKK